MDSPLTIEKIVIPSDIPTSLKKKLDKIHSSLAKPPFRMILAGPSNSGKTNLLINLLTKKNFYKNFWKPENVFLFSPTVKLDKKLQMIKTKNIFNEWDNEVVEEIIRQQNAILDRPEIDYDADGNIIKKRNNAKKLPHVLIILDDMIESSAFGKKSALGQLIFKARHYRISIIITAQKLSSINRIIRLNSDIIYLFEPSNSSEIDFILDENSDKSSRINFLNNMRKVYETPYNFISIDYQTNDKKKRYRESFGDYLDMYASSSP